MKYCKRCGGKMIKKPTGYYNENTGKPEKKYRCQDPCCNGNHDWHIGLFTYSPCKRCGQHPYVGF